MKRVLRPGGKLLIDDRSVPEDDFVDRCMNELDRLHDPSHVRQYRPSEWQAMLEAHGFQVECIETYTKHRPVKALTLDVNEKDAAEIHRILNALDDTQKAIFNYETKNGEPHTNHWYVTALAARP